MTQIRLSLMLAVVIVGSSPAISQADLPVDRTVTLYIRETPTDPQSDVIWTVTCSIAAVEVLNDAVSWRITAVTMEENDDNYAPHRKWSEEFPWVDTPDGLWWVEHSDPLKPESSEFVELPPVNGTAPAVHEGIADLEYEFEGASSGTPYLYGGSVSDLTFRFNLAGESNALRDGDEEPVEVDGEDEPPLGGG